MSELVQHLKREKDVLKGQLAIEKSERTALQKKLETKERELNLVSFTHLFSYQAVMLD
jgi:hypothetical protein